MSVVEEGSLQGGRGPGGLKYPWGPISSSQALPGTPYPTTGVSPYPSQPPQSEIYPTNPFLAWPSICQFSRLKLVHTHPNLRPVHTHQLSKQHFTPLRFPNQPTHVSSLLLIPMTVPLFQPTVVRETLHSSELTIMNYCT